MMRMSTPLSRRCVAWFVKLTMRAVPERMHGDALGQPRRLGRRAAGRVQDLHVDRLALVAARIQPLSRPGQTPVSAQDRQQLR